MATEMKTVSDDEMRQHFAEMGIYGVYDMIPAEVVEDTVRQIAERFQPEKIILFGSYAYGTPRIGSDIDLLVIMNTELPVYKQAHLIRMATGHRFSIDLLVRTPEMIEERLALGDPFIREVLEKGKVMSEHLVGASCIRPAHPPQC